MFHDDKKELNASKKTVVICWLRRDLRLHDNTALYHALRSKIPVLLLFVFDRHILAKLSDKRDKRVTFIHQTLKHLNVQLNQLGSSLCCKYDTPQNAMKIVCNDYEVKGVFFNRDYEPEALARDAAVGEFLEGRNIPFHSFKDQVIFEKSEVTKEDGKPYTVFTPYSRKWKSKYEASQPMRLPSEDILSGLVKINDFSFPSLEEIGFKKSTGGAPALQLSEEIIRNYHKTRDFPAMEGTSQVSPYLRFGLFSIRDLVEMGYKFNEQWLNELIWREFFMMILFHFPRLVHQSFKTKYDHIPWRNDEGEFNLWCKGETGYPIVDAAMRQLNETGWMHNRARMIVASFLTKHLLIDWRWGEAYFAEKLLDYEMSSNIGNWQWAAGSGCDAVPYFRIFNPHLQTRKFDPELHYIKKWIKGYKEGYLPPVVDHDFARKRALKVYKSALIT